MNAPDGGADTSDATIDALLETVRQCLIRARDEGRVLGIAEAYRQMAEAAPDPAVDTSVGNVTYLRDPEHRTIKERILDACKAGEVLTVPEIAMRINERPGAIHGTINAHTYRGTPFLRRVGRGKYAVPPPNEGGA